MNEVDDIHARIRAADVYMMLQRWEKAKLHLTRTSLLLKEEQLQEDGVLVACVVI